MRRMNKTLFGNLCEEQAYLYIVKLHNDLESFYKIGVTSKKEVSSRFSGIPYNYEIIKTYSHPSSTFIMDLESQLLSLVERYNPLKTFGGYSECVLEVENIIKYVESLSWITELEEFVPSTYKTALGRVPSVQSLVKEYTTIVESARINPDFRIELEQFLTNNSEFSEWLEAGVTPQNMNTLNSRPKIQQLARDLKILSKVEKVNLPFRVGQIYSKTKIKEVIQQYYDNNGIKLKAKATDIKKYFDVKTTTNAKAEGCFKIIKKL